MKWHHEMIFREVSGRHREDQYTLNKTLLFLPTINCGGKARSENIFNRYLLGPVDGLLLVPSSPSFFLFSFSV
jgi:hypothetical protein